MRFVLDIIYLLGMIIALPYYLFRFATSSYYRAGLFERFGFIRYNVSDRPRIWLHGASVGEINACAALIRKLQSELPDYQLVISTLTPSAQALVKKKYPELVSFYFPIDLSFICNKVLKRVNPKLVILMEQELWPNFIMSAARQDIPVMLLNGRITERSLGRYNLVKWLIGSALREIKLYCAQNDSYKDRFMALGISEAQIKVTGNMKYDSLVIEDNDNGVSDYLEPVGAERLTGSYPDTKWRDYRKIFDIGPHKMVLIGGSTHAPEEEVLLDAWQRLNAEFGNIRLILAPRHSFRFDEVARIIKAKGFAVTRHSKLISEIRPAIRRDFAHAQQSTSPQAVPLRGAIRNNGEVILLDTMGELARVYAGADIVFVGGTLVPRGGQSILEPAALGKPIVAGPSLYNFTEPAQLLQAANALAVINNPEELYQSLKEIISNPELRVRMGHSARQAIAHQQGASQRNIGLIKQILDDR